MKHFLSTSSFRRNFLFDFEEGERKFNPESDLVLKRKSDSGSSRLAFGGPLVRNDMLRVKSEIDSFYLTLTASFKDMRDLPSLIERTGQ